MSMELRRETFVLQKLRQSTSRFGQPYTVCELHDSAGQVWPAYAWQRFPHPTLWPDGVEVLATVQERSFGTRQVLDVLAMDLAALSDSVQGKTQPQLPFPEWLVSQATQPRLLRELWVQITLMDDPWLCHFNQRILHDPDISLRWVTIPASRTHHHAEASGLLRHSLEAFRLLSKSPQMSLLEWDIARTALLWHDVGKILTYPGGTRRAAEGFLVPHETATAEVLAWHLAWLRQRAPDLVTALKLHWYPPRHGRPLMPGQIFVEACDRVSAALDSRQQAFQEEPAWRQIGTVEGPGPASRFWRLREG
ncbi:TraI domain-containing protein [Acidithiobacillus sp. IBUN Pt1247-S3]|uniref:TraI domain-containing protein n=1 Tax=Acidithiobacillus sp. IBUN Pt1247-S3 TaxID=3166642 RepID=UPI0034E5345A